MQYIEAIEKFAPPTEDVHNTCMDIWRDECQYRDPDGNRLEARLIEYGRYLHDPATWAAHKAAFGDRPSMVPWPTDSPMPDDNDPGWSATLREMMNSEDMQERPTRRKRYPLVGASAAYIGRPVPNLSARLSWRRYADSPKGTAQRQREYFRNLRGRIAVNEVQEYAALTGTDR